MQLRQLEEMYAAERDHWWFAGKRLLFRRLLAPWLARGNVRMLDVGCGTGAVAADFGRDGWLCAADRSIDALAFARTRGVTNTTVLDGDALPFARASFDVILAFDVAEHVDDDTTFVRELVSLLRPSGVLAIHVPAWPFLWSRHDEILEHKRRYTRRSLGALLQRANARTLHLGWSTCAMFPAAAAVRTLRRLVGTEPDTADVGTVPAPINATLLAIMRAEAVLAATVGLPIGLSLAALVAAHDGA